MTCVKCGFLYCTCSDAKPLLMTDSMKLNRVEQTMLEMWEVWIDGRKDSGTDDESDPAPRIALDFFRRDNRVSWLLLELMAKWAREYGYEL